MIFLYAWLLMLLVGGAHHEIDPGIPAISYWAALVLSALIYLISVPFRSER